MSQFIEIASEPMFGAERGQFDEPLHKRPCSPSASRYWAPFVVVGEGGTQEARK
jgi:hypothetical protein